MIDGAQKHEGRDGYVSGDEGEGLCRGGRHRVVLECMATSNHKTLAGMGGREIIVVVVKRRSRGGLALWSVAARTYI
jgi:hypothetical protein